MQRMLYYKCRFLQMFRQQNLAIECLYLYSSMWYFLYEYLGMIK